MSTNNTSVTTWEAVEAFIKVEYEHLAKKREGGMPTEQELTDFYHKLVRFRSLVDGWAHTTPSVIADKKREDWGE